MLLETPSRAGTYGSALISIDNDDTAAANLWRAHEIAGLPREVSLVWNAVPWYVGDPDRIRPARGAEIAQARPHLRALLGLLAQLQVLITFGRAAQRALLPFADDLSQRRILVLAAPHPSQRVYNAPTQRARERVHAAFVQAAAELTRRRP